jgi:hypothetical protein
MCISCAVETKLLIANAFNFAVRVPFHPDSVPTVWNAWTPFYLAIVLYIRFKEKPLKLLSCLWILQANKVFHNIFIAYGITFMCHALDTSTLAFIDFHKEMLCPTYEMDIIKAE